MRSENDAPTGTLVGASVGHADVEHYQAIITGERVLDAVSDHLTVVMVPHDVIKLTE